jgi:hypothetical protein
VKASASSSSRVRERVRVNTGPSVWLAAGWQGPGVNTRAVGLFGAHLMGRSSGKNQEARMCILAGNIRCTSVCDKGPSGTGGCTGKPSVRSTPGDTAGMVHVRPTSEKARSQGWPHNTSFTALHTKSSQSWLLTCPARLRTCSACHACRSLHFSRANTRVSRGCSSHVILAGT